MQSTSRRSWLIFKYCNSNGPDDEGTECCAADADGDTCLPVDEDGAVDAVLTLDYFPRDVGKNDVETTPENPEASAPTLLCRNKGPWIPLRRGQ